MEKSHLFFYLHLLIGYLWRRVEMIVTVKKLKRSVLSSTVISIAIVAITGCQDRPFTAGKGLLNKITEDDSSLICPKYAKGFRWEEKDQSYSLILTDPWKPGRVFARYRLIAGDVDKGKREGTQDIGIPVSSVAASSTTHAAFLSAIGAGDRLTGCNNPEKLYDSVLYNRFVRGDLVRMGRDLEYNLEYLVAKKPDVVLQSGLEGQFNPDSRLTDIGIPVLYILEWMEPTPLGRAEWIRVFGMLAGKRSEADSLFNAIEGDYLALADLGHSTVSKPKVLAGTDFKGTWYMPGGRNYQARFFEDAGMDYIYRQTDQAASLALSFETVVNDLRDAPVWVGTTTDSVSRLISMDGRYSVFWALRSGRVYSITNRVNHSGGNDYWESGVVRPDKILADLLYIAHPELLPGHIWNYYKPMIAD